MKKSQTSTEYLIILAVVIVIAIVAINTLGGFPGIGATNTKKVSDYRLQTGTVGIDSFVIGTNSSLFKLKNNYFDTVTITEFRVNQQSNLTCNSSNTVPALPVVLNVGQSMIINCSIVNSSSYIITDRQTPVVGISYTDNLGATRTAGNVQSYASTNVSGGSQTYTPSATVLALRNGLVAYYPLDGNASDFSGNGNDGTNNGASYNQSGKVGGAYSFDGSNSYISIPRTSNLNFGSSDFTISLWAYFDVNNIGYQLFFDGRGDSDYTGYPLYLEWNNQLSFLSSSSYGWDNVALADAGPIPSAGQWTQIMVTRAGDRFTMYKDGVSVAYGDYSGNIADVSAPITIGKGHSNTIDNAFDGKMDEVAIWNRALNATEILNLYNNDSGLSLSLSGAQAPECVGAQTGCNDSNYLTCSNNNWVDNGLVYGQCDYCGGGPCPIEINYCGFYLSSDTNYILNADLDCSGACTAIEGYAGPNTVIDLNGHSIIGRDSGDCYGVAFVYSHDSTIKNGIIRNFGNCGIAIWPGRNNNRIINVTLSNNHGSCLWVGSDNNIVTNVNCTSTPSTYNQGTNNTFINYTGTFMP